MDPEITLLSIKLIFPSATLTCCANKNSSICVFLKFLPNRHLWASRRQLAIISAWFKYIILDCIWIWRIVMISHFSYDPCSGNFRRASFLFRAQLSAGSLCHDPTFPSEGFDASVTRMSFERQTCRFILADFAFSAFLHLQKNVICYMQMSNNILG